MAANTTINPVKRLTHGSPLMRPMIRWTLPVAAVLAAASLGLAGAPSATAASRLPDLPTFAAGCGEVGAVRAALSWAGTAQAWADSGAVRVWRGFVRQVRDGAPPCSSAPVRL